MNNLAKGQSHNYTSFQSPPVLPSNEHWAPAMLTHARSWLTTMNYKKVPGSLSLESKAKIREIQERERFGIKKTFIFEGQSVWGYLNAFIKFLFILVKGCRTLIINHSKNIMLSKTKNLCWPQVLQMTDACHLILWLYDTNRTLVGGLRGC